MNEDLKSQQNHSRLIITCLIAVSLCGFVSTLFINYQLYQSRNIAHQIGNSTQYSLSTLTPMLNEQQQIVENIYKAKREANLSYVFTRNILKELKKSNIENSTKEILINMTEQGIDKVKSVRSLIDESMRFTDEVGGNFNFMIDQLENLGRVKDVETSLTVVFRIALITLSLLTLVLLLSTLFIHYSLKRIKIASEQALKARAELQQSQVQQKISELNCLLSGERSIDDLSKNFLEFLAPNLGAGVAAFYYLENDILCFKQGYAYSSDAGKCYKLGEGIIGQVAVQKTVIELEQVAEGYLDITSGMGSVAPNRVIAVPIIKDQSEDIKGVIEFGLFTPLTGFQYALLQESIGVLTISIRSAEYRNNLNQLLHQSEQQKYQLEVNSKKLIEARDEAQQATRTKSDFLAAMSHEIRTPMNGVLGMLQVLQDTGMSKEQSKYLQVISGSAESLLKIINDILDFSKIEAGKIELENVPFDLLLLIEDVIEQLYNNAREKEISLLMYFDPNVPRLVKGDPGRVRQILINLLGNGIKFTHQGYVQLNIEVLAEKDGKSNIVFKVKDTGVGIEDNKIDMIFNQFTQSDSSTSRQFGGTGLGLSISKCLTELMGGQITAISKIGQGSLFSFNILLDKQEGNVNFPSRDLHQQKILLADSNELRSRMIQDQIASWGLDYSHVSNIEQLLSTLREEINERNHYDILIIDEDLVSSIELNYLISENRPLSLEGSSMIMLQSEHKKELIEADGTCFSGVLSNPVKPSDLMDHIAVAWDSSESILKPSSTEKTVQTSVEPSTIEPLPFNLDAMQILLVDDNKVNQKVAAVMLKQLGLSADIAGNGEEAIAMLIQSPYDLVLMDCQMPVMDGYTATREIRQSQQPFSNIYIIALTANAMNGDKEKCLEAGMNDYLTKPLRKADLLAKLQKVLKSKCCEQETR